MSALFSSPRLQRGLNGFIILNYVPICYLFFLIIFRISNAVSITSSSQTRTSVGGFIKVYNANIDCGMLECIYVQILVQVST